MIDVIRNQPIQTRFNTCTKEKYELIQLVETTDQQRIQVLLSPYKVESAFLSSAFTLTTCYVSGANGIGFIGAGFATANSGCTFGKTYQIEFQADFVTIDNNGGYRVRVNNQFVTLPDASNGSYSILSGRIVAFVTINSFYPVVPPQIDFKVIGDTVVRISGIIISELSSCSLAVLDEAKTPVQDFGDALTVYNRNSNIATVILQWADVTASGVCYLALYDPKGMNVEQVTNGTFNVNANSWENSDGTALDGWIHDGAGKVAYVGTGTDTNNRLSQFLTLRGGDIYKVDFTLSDVNVISDEGCWVSFDIDGTLVDRFRFDANGTYTHYINLLDYTGFIAGRLTFEPRNLTDLFKVDSISMKRVTDTNNITNPFRLQANHSHTLELLGICNQSAFGFNFLHFQSQIRVKGKIQYKEYPDLTEVYDFSNNVAEIIDSTVKKFYEVTIHGNPEYIHDAVRLIRLCDYFFINGKEYIKEATYDMKPTEDILSASAVFLVREKVGVPENYFAPGYSDVKYIGG